MFHLLFTHWENFPQFNSFLSFVSMPFFDSSVLWFFCFSYFFPNWGFRITHKVTIQFYLFVVLLFLVLYKSFTLELSEKSPNYLIVIGSTSENAFALITKECLVGSSAIKYQVNGVNVLRWESAVRANEMTDALQSCERIRWHSLHDWLTTYRLFIPIPF